MSFSRKERKLSGDTGQKAMLVLLAIIIVLTTGCMDIKTRIGKMPDTEALEKTLHIGESSQNDVLAALGVPYGKGKEMLPIGKSARTMWSYYYEEGTLKDSRRIFLFVFINQDRYDGYMWFSSLPK